MSETLDFKGIQEAAASQRRISFYERYSRPIREAVPPAADSVFSPHLVVMQIRHSKGPCPQLGLAATLSVANRWREAMLSRTNGSSETVRLVLSGHDANGHPAGVPHAAFLPLAFVGHEQADGHLVGMALALPANLSSNDRREVLRVVGAVRDLKLGPLGVWGMEAVMASRPSWNLRPEAWTAYPRGATHWSTVTPVAFDRHPKAKGKGEYHREVAVMIADACVRIGLPRPREVVVTDVSAHAGAPSSFQFPRMRRKDRGERRHSHAMLVFDEPVCGPVVIGAGRFRGYGVCRAAHTLVGKRERRRTEESEANPGAQTAILRAEFDNWIGVQPRGGDGDGRGE